MTLRANALLYCNVMRQSSHGIGLLRRSVAALLALCLLIGPSLAERHFHLVPPDEGAPIASNEPPAPHHTDAICTICLGIQLAGQALRPDAPALRPPAVAASALSARWEARSPLAPDLAFRSRAPPPV